MAIGLGITAITWSIGLRAFLRHFSDDWTKVTIKLVAYMTAILGVMALTL